MTDLNALAARAVAGDGEALSSLCQQLETPVFQLCLRMLGDTRDAEDAAQDVLIKVITHLGNFQGRSALMTWVHQVTVRHVFAMQKGRAESRAVDEETFAELLEQGLAFGATQPPPSPEDRALLTEVRLSCTQGMLLMLSREERVALVLVELLGWDAAQAAEVAEISHDAMRQRVARARNRLTTFLQAKCGQANPGAACHCEKQLPAKQAMGLTAQTQRFAPLSRGDLVHANAELKAIRAAFQREGAWGAPATLRARLQKLLPTVLT